MSRALAATPHAEATLPSVVSRVAAETPLDRVWIGLGPTVAQERVVADTMPGVPHPHADSHAVLQRDETEERATWTRVRPPAAGSEKRRARDQRRFRVVVTNGSETLGSLWALASAEPPLEASRLLAVTADQVAQAVHRDELAARALELEVAERSDEAKRALLDLVSHDLRTPLAAIRASAGSLADPTLHLGEDERSRLATSIDTEAMRLNRLVENLLGMGRLQGGGSGIEIELIPLADTVRAAVERLAPMLGEHEVVLDLRDDLPPARADATFLDQVLVNLLENAAGHTPPGSRIRVAGRAVDPAAIELVVEDSGPGVPDAELPRLFTRFHRVAGRRHRGAGLGLALVRGMTEAMGGSASAARSDLGGLAITLRLPAAPREPPVEPPG